jgi:quercetin dioxygenase-like cupin family protein
VNYTSKVFRFDSVKADPVTMEGSSRVKVRWLITKEMGAKDFAMRVFEIESGGYSPLHKHPWEHEIFILEGIGLLIDDQKTTPFKAGDTVFVPPNQLHQFRNDGQTQLRFLCMIPYLKG